ncbi:MAG: cupin domain-containing protein [Bdellovibrionaceae bacterium]|nr:cupin domain-containing protein [Pseudobdellovibrionaceae bacterium]
MYEANEIIKRLDLKPLPEEGGYYRETYRSNYGDAPAKIFGIDSETNRTISTGIYYLVIPESFSALHRVKSDEMFHFYSGDPVEMIQIDQNGKLTRFTLGSDIFSGQEPQVVVPRGVWQALRLKAGGKWALMGTTVAPGFEFEDFEVGIREAMIQQFPQHQSDIIRFTREPNEKAH